MLAAVIPAVLLSLVVIGLAWWNLRRPRNQLSRRERENEANADFRPSADGSDPMCPRCHGKGVTGVPPMTCPLCDGHRHVRFGPGA